VTLGALFSGSDILFMVGVIVATTCFLIAFVEWYENGSIGFALAFIAGALGALMLTWMMAW
jgi:hypothetical protein